MKIRRFIMIMLLPVGLLVFTGCPIPAYYIIMDSDTSGKGAFHMNDCVLSITSVSPWLDTKKKVIIFSTKITNTSVSQPGVFVLSGFQLRSASDTFRINYTNRNMNNPFFVEQDTVRLQPGEARALGIYFLSGKDYNGRTYKRSIETDTLTLTYTPINKTIRLLGKRNH